MLPNQQWESRERCSNNDNSSNDPGEITGDVVQGRQLGCEALLIPHCQQSLNDKNMDGQTYTQRKMQTHAHVHAGRHQHIDNVCPST